MCPELGSFFKDNLLNLTIKLSRYKFASRLIRKTDSVLDVGCGYGLGSMLLSQWANSVTGVDVSKYRIEQCSKINLRENLKFIELDDWNWAAHDYHHGEVRIDTKGKEFIDISKIGGKDTKRIITGYKGPKNTGYEYMDKKQSLVVSDEYWLKVIGLYFDKIGFTKGASGIDVWPSIYSYCLTKMSSENDAYKIDFSIVNEKGKRSLITSSGEYKNLKEFFKAAYKNVHNFSTLSRFSSEDPKNLIHKLQDGYIYICLF